jgi:hypothetical protein
MELVSVLFHCLPYSLLFILCKGVINNVTNVTPCEGIGPSKKKEFLIVSCWIVWKGAQFFSVWEIFSIEKGTWTLTVPSAPATSHRGQTGTTEECVEVGSCRGVGACVQDQVWEGVKGREGAGLRKGFLGKRGGRVFQRGEWALRNWRWGRQDLD